MWLSSRNKLKTVVLSLSVVGAFLLTGCGGGGGTPNPTPNPTPTPVQPPSITSVSPNSVTAGGPGFTLTVNGNSFLSGSVVQWDGNARPTTIVSPSQLQASISSSDVAAGAANNVTVSNAAGVSGPASVTVNNPLPAISSLNPAALAAGGSAFTLTVTGSNFVPTSVIQFNGVARATTFVSSITLQAAISASDIASVGLAKVAVFNPAPAGGSSGNLTLTAAFPPPTIKVLTPGSAVKGGGDFTVVVSGANFVPASVVKFNGSVKSTTFISSTELHATITAADISTVGVANVSVANVVTNVLAAVANAGIDPTTSAPFTFFTGSTGGTGFAQAIINQGSQDIVYDPSQQLIYVSVTGSAATNPNTLSVLSLASAAITSSQPTGANPNILAISDDGHFLYAGIDGAASIQRFTLPGPTQDISIPLGADPFFGAFHAEDLQVAPGAPHTLAVTLANSSVSPAEQGGVAIFDDATQRPTKFPGGANLVHSLQWGADATRLFGSDIFNGLDALSVSPTGVSLINSFNGVSRGERIHVRAAANLIYGEAGDVFSTGGVTTASLNVGGAAAIDPDLNAAFVLPQNFFGPLAIDAFDLSRFTLNRSLPLTGVTGTPRRMIRWGQNGLAFNTDGGQIVLVAGNFLDPITSPPGVPVPIPTPTPAPNPSPQAPAISFLNPGSAIAGGTGLSLTVQGTNFTPSSVVQFNGGARTTTFISASQLQAAITTADIATVGVATVTVLDSANGTSTGSTFLIGSSGGAGFALTAIAEPANDIAVDPARQALYLSVPNTVPEGNSVAVLDLASAKIVGTQFAGSNPGRLSISDNSQFLYTGLDGNASVQRFALPALTADVSYPLGADSFFGPYFALDLQAAPGAPHTSAVSRGIRGSSPSALGGIVIFDDATPRPVTALGFGQGGAVIYDSLQWGANATSLFGADLESSGADFFTLAVNANGISLAQDIQSIGSGRLHRDPGTNLIYGENGRVLDQTGSAAGVFKTSGLLVPDSTLNTAFFLNQSFGANTATIQSFDLTHFTPVGSITIPVSGQARHLVRWGQNGLAFNTDTGQVVLVGGSFLAPVSAAFPAPNPLPAPPPAPAANAPAITLLSPSSAVAGSVGFTLTVNGSNFDPSAQVLFNGVARTTTFLSSTQLQASINASDIAAAGTAIIAVANPANNGGTSAGSTFFVGTTGGNGFAVSVLNQTSNDLIYDPLHHVIMLSVPSTATAHGNTISALDPSTETIISSQFAGSEPGILALSDDSHFLYAGIDGASRVQRFTLPDFGRDINYSLGNGGFINGANFAKDLQVAPGAANTTAVITQGGTITVFDDATPRAATASGGGGSIQWGVDASTLLSTGASFGDLFTFSVAPGGLTRTNDFTLDVGGRIHFDRAGQLVWAENGHVADPVTGSPTAVLAASGSTVTDSSLNLVFVLTQPGGNSATVQAFDMTHFTLVGSITIPNVNGNVKRLIRWGQNGLAFNTDSGQLFLLGGNFVSPVSSATPPATPLPAPPPTPAANAPTIALLTPSSALAGGIAFTITVNGTNFDPAATVGWNGSARTTTFISSTQLQASISAPDIASAGTAIITVANPIANGGTSAGSTFFIGSSAGASFAVSVINQAANDLAFDPLHRVILLSVPGAAAAHGNTITALDLSGNVISSQFAGSQPNVLALSGDSQFVYAGIDGGARVNRYALPAFTLDTSYSLGTSFFSGPLTALDLQVAPGASHTSAVVSSGFNPSGKITIFDDATPRTNFATNGNSLQWGANASSLFSSQTFGSDLLSLFVDATGAIQIHDFASFLSGRRIHFDQATGRIYSDGGAVLDSATGTALATLPASGLMVVDSQLNAAYVLEQPFSGGNATIDTFDVMHFVKTGSITITGVNGTAGRLIRWAENGLAFNTSDGHVFLVGGNIVSPISTATPPAAPLPTPPPPAAPGPSTPIISSLSPGSAVAGGPDVALTITGTNFTASSVVRFNGTALATTFTSGNQLTATIPAAQIASGGTDRIVVVDPNGTSNPSLFFVGATAATGTGGTSFAFTSINQAANSLIFDPVHQVFFISVPGSGSSLGNTVTALDLSGNVISSQFAGSEPGALAVSDDGLFLYAGINGAGKAQRYALPSFSPDISYSLGTPSQFGPVAALDLQVAPGAAHTAAFATGSATASFIQDGVVIFDDAVQRTNRAFTQASSIQWGAGNTALLGADSFGSDLLVMAVDANGVTGLHDFFPFTQSTRVHFNAATGFAYGNDGHVVDPATGTVVGSFVVAPPSATNLMIPDSSLGKAFFLSQTQNAGVTTVTLQSFNLTSFALLNSITIPNLNGTVQTLVRWGSNGLAFSTSKGQIVLLGGSFVN
jgi:hypothetical protein